jgi:hypothetical protein
MSVSSWERPLWGIRARGGPTLDRLGKNGKWSSPCVCLAKRPFVYPGTQDKGERPSSLPAWIVVVSVSQSFGSFN